MDPYIYIHSFIHLVACLKTGPKLLPNRAVHLVRSRASSFKWDYLLLSLRSPISFLRLPVTSIPSFIFPSIILCRRQFVRKMWPIQLGFRLLISCWIFLCSLTLYIYSLSNGVPRIADRWPSAQFHNFSATFFSEAQVFVLAPFSVTSLHYVPNVRWETIQNVLRVKVFIYSWGMGIQNNNITPPTS